MWPWKFSSPSRRHLFAVDSCPAHRSLLLPRRYRARDRGPSQFVIEPSSLVPGFLKWSESLRLRVLLSIFHSKIASLLLSAWRLRRLFSEYIKNVTKFQMTCVIVTDFIAIFFSCVLDHIDSNRRLLLIELLTIKTVCASETKDVCGANSCVLYSLSLSHSLFLFSALQLRYAFYFSDAATALSIRIWISDSVSHCFSFPLSSVLALFF